MSSVVFNALMIAQKVSTKGWRGRVKLLANIARSERTVSHSGRLSGWVGANTLYPAM